MYTLFLDTHSHLITVSLYNEKNTITKTQESNSSHAVYLVPMIDSILKENNLTVKNIDSIVAVNGPGSFTGLRIGLSVAKTMAYSLNVPIYLISSLTSYLISDDSATDKIAIIEENKGYYISIFNKNNESIQKECFVTDIDGFNNLHRVEEKLNVEKIIKYAKNTSSINPHLVRANYVKTIEAEK